MRRAGLGPVLVALAAAGSGCGRAAPRIVSAPEPAATAITVTAAGVTLGQSQVSVGAAVRNGAPAAARRITLAIGFLDRGGGLVATTTDSLPWCPAGATCPWGGTFVGSQFGDRWRTIARARFTARVAFWGGAPAAPAEFPVARGPDGVVRGTIPGTEGDVYVVGFAGGRPVSGVALVIRPGDVPSRNLADARLLPPAPDERLRAFFYPGSVPQGS